MKQPETVIEAEKRVAVGATDLLAALDAITRLGGNLDDDRHTDKTGPNDARQRGLMYCAARDIARNALEAHYPNWKPVLEWKSERKRAAND